MTIRPDAWLYVCREAQDKCPGCGRDVLLFDDDSECWQQWHEGLERWLLLCNTTLGRIKCNQWDTDILDLVCTNSSDLTRIQLAKAHPRYVS